MIPIDANTVLVHHAGCWQEHTRVTLAELYTRRDDLAGVHALADVLVAAVSS